MFSARLHVKDARRKTPITNAAITGQGASPTNVKQSRPGLYELTLSAPGDIRLRAPDYLGNETYL